MPNDSRFGRHERRLVYLAGLLADTYGTAFTGLPLDGRMRALAYVLDLEDHDPTLPSADAVRRLGYARLRACGAPPRLTHA